MIFTVVGMLLVDRVGRRPLFVLSLIGVVLSLLVLAQAFYLADVHSPHANTTLSDAECQFSSCFSCLSHHHCGFCAGPSATAVGQCFTRVHVDSNHTVCSTSRWHAANDDYAVSSVCPDTYSWMALLGMTLYLATFAFGVTSLPWAINAEIFPTHLRAAGSGYATSVNWIWNLGVALTFLSLTESITTAGTFWLYAGIGVLCTLYIYFQLPETKGRTLEEIEDIFRRPGDADVVAVKEPKEYLVQ